MGSTTRTQEGLAAGNRDAPGRNQRRQAEATGPGEDTPTGHGAPLDENRALEGVDCTTADLLGDHASRSMEHARQRRV